MEYKGLSHQDLFNLREDGLTEAQIEKQNKRALTKCDRKLQRFTLKKFENVGPANELRLVLVGKTGAGKSSTGNLILGEERFPESAGSESCTKHIQEESTEVEGVHIRIIDTPGFFDTNDDPQHILTEIAKFLDNFSDGVHGFLFVYPLANPRFTQEEKAAFEELKKAFDGESFCDHCFIILTHGDSMLGEGQSLRDKVCQERGTLFGDLLTSIVKSKVIAVDNTDPNNYFRAELRKQIVCLITQNVTQPYIDVTFQEFCDDKAKVAEAIPEPVRHLSYSMENKVSNHFEKMSHHRIIELSEAERQKIIEEVYKKIRDEHKGPFPDAQVREAIPKVMEGKKERLTSKKFFEMIKGFAIGFLKVAGIVAGTALKILIMGVNPIQAVLVGVSSIAIQLMQGDSD